MNASAVDDVDGLSQVVEFKPNQNSGSCVFTIVNDAVPEGNETFSVDLAVSVGNGITVSPSVAYLTILANDDAFGIIGFNEVSNCSSPVSCLLFWKIGGFINCIYSWNMIVLKIILSFWTWSLKKGKWTGIRQKKKKKQTEASDSLKELLHRLLLFVVKFPDFFVVLYLKQTKQCF